jgi:branched-chain amino acid aminotransferase
MILLNQWGRVAEATGSAVLIVRDNRVITPCHTEGALESITVDCVESIADSMQVEFMRRPLDRTELLIADEICICGSLAEMVPVKSIDGFDIDPDGPILNRLRSRFSEIVHGDAEHEGIAISPVPL